MSRPDSKIMKNRKRLCQALIKKGCYLFPIKRHRKLPKGMWSEISTNDLAQVEEWLEKKLNIGVDTGKSNLLVIDLDPKDEDTADEMQSLLELIYEEFPDTFTVNTPSGGRHLYFKRPVDSGLGNTQGVLLDHVDTRGVGGYVVGPSSNFIPKAQAEELLVQKTFKTEDGKSIEYEDFDYQTLYKEDIVWQYYHRKEGQGPVSFAELPTSYLAKLTAAKESPTKGVACEVDEDAVDTNQAVDGAIDYCLNQHPASIEGDGGNTTTYQLFTRLRDMGLTLEVVIEIAYDYYNDRCEPPWELEEMMSIAEHAYDYAKEPLGIMSAHADFKDDDEEAYDPDVLQIVIPETGETFNPVRNQERAEKPVEERTKERKEEKHNEKITATEREANRLNLAFSSQANKVRYVYVAAEDEVYNRLSGTVLKPAAFNRSKRLEYMQYMEDNKVGAFEAAEDMGHLVHAESFEYQPGEAVFTPHPTDKQAIVWNTYTKPDIEAKQGATPSFDAYLDALFDKPGDREVVLKFLAYTVQNPIHIHSFALVVFGNHGSGKTLLGELLGTMVGESNFGIVSAPDIKSQFNGWAMNKQVILLDECFDLGTLEIANKLKTHIGAKTIPINRKNKNMIDVVNYANFVITSNYTDAVRMDQGERRYYVIETNRDMGANAPDTTNVILNPIFDMTRRRTQAGKDELSAVYHKLMNMDLADYNPSMLPKRTQAMEHMIEANRSDWQSFLTDAIDNYESGFHCSAYAIPDMVKLLKQEGYNKVRPGPLESYLVNQGYLVEKQCRYRPAKGHEYRKDIVVLRDRETWYEITTVKRALAEYCHTISSQTVEYATDDEKPVTVKTFIKQFQAGNTVTKIK